MRRMVERRGREKNIGYSTIRRSFLIRRWDASRVLGTRYRTPKALETRCKAPWLRKTRCRTPFEFMGSQPVHRNYGAHDIGHYDCMYGTRGASPGTWDTRYRYWTPFGQYLCHNMERHKETRASRYAAGGKDIMVNA